MAQRVRHRRTIRQLLELMHMKLLSVNRDDDKPTRAAERKARQGLFAKLNEKHVMIVRTFTRRRVPLAVVCPLVESAGKDGEWRAGPVENCHQQDLMQIGFHFEVRAVGRNRRVTFVRRTTDEDETATTKQCRSLADTRSFAASLCEAHSASRSLSIEMVSVRAITPAAAEEHQRQHPGHRTAPREAKGDPTWILNLPMPRPLDLRPHRCITCKNNKRNKQPAYFKVQWSDVKRAHPDILRARCGSAGTMYFTTAFLVHLLQVIYEEFNVRKARRRIADIYLANFLGLAAASATVPALMSPAILQKALPRDDLLTNVTLRAFRNFVKGVVARMRRRQLLYNAKVIRGDGNYKLAKRHRLHRGKGDFTWTVVLGWCALDGSLLQPFHAKETEAFPHIEEDLEPMLKDIRDYGLGEGDSLEDTVPLTQSTDVYERHKPNYTKLYASVWKALGVQDYALTPRADSLSLDTSVSPQDRLLQLWCPSGEPRHNVIAHQKLVSPFANDARDMKQDHADLLNRLSAPLPSAETMSALVPPTEVSLSLSTPGRTLLHTAVERSAKEFKAAFESDPAAAASLRKFLGHEHVLFSTVWMEEFGAFPVRGTISRIARRIGAVLHPRNGFINYGSLDEFRAQLARMQPWYEPGRKRDRAPRRGIRRTLAQKARERGRRSAWSTKLTEHYRKLKRKNCLEGLWAWRQVALALHSAGIRVHSGTIPCERLWANAESFFPRESRGISLGLFEFLADLAYIRYNHRHFNHSTLPGWARGDTLLAERVDTLLEIWHAIDAPDTSPAQALAAICAEEFPDDTIDVGNNASDGPGNEGEPMQPSSEDQTELAADSSSGEAPVRIRRLQAIWSDALAEGHKPWESQRYTKQSMGHLRWCQRDALIVFSPGGVDYVAGVAVLAGPATQGCSLEEGPHI